MTSVGVLHREQQRIRVCRVTAWNGISAWHYNRSVFNAFIYVKQLNRLIINKSRALQINFIFTPLTFLNDRTSVYTMQPNHAYQAIHLLSVMRGKNQPINRCINENNGVKCTLDAMKYSALHSIASRESIMQLEDWILLKIKNEGDRILRYHLPQSYITLVIVNSSSWEWIN